MDLAKIFARIGECGQNGCHVTLTYAQSMDGCIARQPGVPFSISSPETFEFTHKLRAVHDAILVGIGTVLADNPSLTTRLVDGENPQPVIIDSKLRMPTSCKLLCDERCTKKPFIVCTEEGYSQDRASELVKAGAHVIKCQATDEGSVNLASALNVLGKRFKSIMVEGGAGIITSLLNQPSLVNRVILTIAPKFFGGFHGVRSVIKPDFEQFWKIEYVEQIGEDIVVSCVPR